MSRSSEVPFESDNPGREPVTAHRAKLEAMTTERDPDRRERRNPFRDEVWGDEPQEVDASEFVEELRLAGRLARRWHDHPTIVPFKVVGRFIGRNSKRVAITIAGFAVVLAGAAMSCSPGQGFVIIRPSRDQFATEYI